MKGFRVPVAILQQLFVTDREERAAERREDGELIVRPFDRRQRRAKRLDLLAAVKRPAADQQVVDAARFERVHVCRA